MTRPIDTPPPLDACGLTDRGRVKDRNDDQFVLGDLGRSMLVQSSSLDIADASRVPAPLRAHLMLVADGTGRGSTDGLASTTAAAEASRYVLESMPCRNGDASDEEIEDGLRELVRSCDAAVRRVATDDDHGGAALTLAYLKESRMHVAHVGSSRCYVLRDDRLEPLTAAPASPALADDTARASAAGGRPPLGEGDVTAPEVLTLDLRDVDAVLLCSDGLIRHVGEADITTILGVSPTAESACRALVDEANARGGNDNVTVVVAYLSSRAALLHGVEGRDEATAKRAASAELDEPAAVHHLRPERPPAAPPPVSPGTSVERQAPVRGRPPVEQADREVLKCSM